MIRFIEFFTIIHVILGCGPVTGPLLPAMVALFTDENFDAAKTAYYKSLATDLMKNVFSKYGLPYIEGWAQITPRNDGGMVTIDVKISSVDCGQLHQLVTLLKNEIFLIEYAGYRCGSNPIVYVR
ncbi:hypothetical protein NECAME_06316 [Necator americanus]|uniref:Uncharacterized protein n=1 Tax=Necator americanus TaxID=51031 RepID=W2TUV8_NECAM|nr:hypothetical protein NECAME_06316 [Necator americanus]ETN85613.1 hypothetical protein NECAME_06316 [Necator americanus]